MAAYSKKEMKEGLDKTHLGWCFTINNPLKPDCDCIENLIPMAKYLIVGNEHAWTKTKYPVPDQTHHFQCYVNFKNAKDFLSVKKLLPRANIRWSKGEAVENQKYCSKEGDFKEWGTCPASRKRKGEKGGEAIQERWRKIRKLAADRDYEGLEAEFPHELSKWKGAIDRIAMEKGKPLNMARNTICGTWIYGPSGTGKSTYATEVMEPDMDKIFFKDVDRWWDGFDPSRHTLVFIDDFDCFTPQFARLLKLWAQPIAFPAEYKGGKMLIRPKHIVITSQYRICDIWKDEKTRAALWRRFHQKCKMTLESEVEDDVNYKEETENKGGRIEKKAKYFEMQ